jgi:hypothetical protein
MDLPIDAIEMNLYYADVLILVPESSTKKAGDPRPTKEVTSYERDDALGERSYPNILYGSMSYLSASLCNASD